jgi:shikimate kinase
VAKSIILIGPPGSGKSTVGRALSRKLNISFTDTDDLIEVRAGTSISQIFIDKGEPWFRDLEKEVLQSELAKINGVLSLGGGAPLSEPAQEMIRKIDAAVIYLDVSLATAAPRVGFNRDRPLLLGNPRAQWNELMSSRRPIYEALATAVVPVDDRTVNEICADILAVA